MEFHQTTVVQVGGQEIFDRPDGEKTTQEKTCSVSVGRAIAAKFWEAVENHGEVSTQTSIGKGKHPKGGQHLSLVELDE